MDNFIQQTLFDSNSFFEETKLIQLKKLFPNCFNKNGEFFADKFNEIIQSLNIPISQESYSLQWLGKSYAKILQRLPPETLLKEDIIHDSKPENKNSQNLLIKGDNLEVLKHLKNAYVEKVKMIYIDPPYNTGSDGFVYQDDRKFTAEQLAELGNMDLDAAQRVMDFTAKQSSSHSAWLTFMFPRLYIARELLREDGVIFISIDDNEQAQLKILCDEIFGEGNFVANIIWERAYSPVNLKKHFSENHDHILCYAKSIINLVCYGLPRNEETENRYSNPDNDPRGSWQSSDLSVGPAIPSNIYEIITPSGRKIMPPSGYSWRLNQDRFQEYIADNRIWFGINGDNVPRIKRFLSEVKNSVTPMTIWKYQEVGHSQSASQNLKRLFNGNAFFTYPKPVELITRLLNLYTEKNSIVMDFFAGSGTTAHAVMKLNAEDKGNRKFILVQLPEQTDKKSEAYEAGFETIFEITKARIEKSAVKIREEFADFNGDLGFKIFETVPDFRMPILENRQAEMYPIPHFSDHQIQTLLTTWRLYDGQLLTGNIEKIDLGNYMAYLGGETLYLLYPELGSSQIKTLIEILDNTEEYADFAPKRIVLHGDFIESSKQKELAQAVQTYANKKSISISLIARV